MPTIGIVFARLDSRRFPAKALSQFQGKPLVLQVLERAARSRELEQVVLATTNRKDDEPLARAVLNAGFGVFCGSLEDVAGRALACAEHFSAEAFARLNGDSPYIDVDLLDLGVSLQRRTGAVLVSNLVPTRTYPYGVAVECLSTKKFAALYALGLDLEEREHITKAIYKHRLQDIVPLPPCPYPCSQTRLTIDSPMDAERLEPSWASLAVSERTLDYVSCMVHESH